MNEPISKAGMKGWTQKQLVPCLPTCPGKKTRVRRLLVQIPVPAKDFSSLLNFICKIILECNLYISHERDCLGCKSGRCTPNLNKSQKKTFVEPAKEKKRKLMFGSKFGEKSFLAKEIKRREKREAVEF